MALNTFQPSMTIPLSDRFAVKYLFPSVEDGRQLDTEHKDWRFPCNILIVEKNGSGYTPLWDSEVFTDKVCPWHRLNTEELLYWLEKCPSDRELTEEQEDLFCECENAIWKILYGK